jgi:hypothetical protein
VKQVAPRTTNPTPNAGLRVLTGSP